MTDDIDAPLGVTEDSFDLMGWIESGTVARREVTIYNDPALVTEYNQLQAQLDELGYSDDEEARTQRAQDATLGDGHGAEIQDLLDRMADLYSRWQDSKAVWTVRAVSVDEINAAQKQLPDPKMPIPPKEGAAQRLQDAWAEKAREYSLEKVQADEDRKLVLLAIAVVGIETPAGSATGATFEQLKALRSRPHGAQWIELLYQAMEAATENDVEIPRPTSSGRSETSQA